MRGSNQDVRAPADRAPADRPPVVGAATSGFGGKSAWGVGAVVGITALFWWTATDRLDLPKLAVFVVGSLGVCMWAWVRRVEPPRGLVVVLCLTPVLVLFAAFSGMQARVEGWAGWVAAVALVSAARRADARLLGRLLCALALGLATLAWLQGAGVTLFTRALGGFSGRRVVATLGGPGHLGWLLAALLPWVSGAAHHWAALDTHATTRSGGCCGRIAKPGLIGVAAALFSGALVLTGSRTAWIAAVVGLAAQAVVCRRASYKNKAYSSRGPRSRGPRKSGRRSRGRSRPSGAPAVKSSPAALSVAGDAPSIGWSPPAWVWWALGGALGGALAAYGLDRMTARARLDAQLADITTTTGTARGRVYIWRVHLWSLDRLLGLGGGPESFQRRWPEIQDDFLRAHPKWERFRSDLRHAHADPIEVLYDFGVFGLLLAFWVLYRLVRGPPGAREKTTAQPGTNATGFRPAQGAALGSSIALATAGLGAPVLFFAPTLALAAAALGVRMGPPSTVKSVQPSTQPSIQPSAEPLPVDHPLGKRAQRAAQMPKSWHGRVVWGLLICALAVTAFVLSARLRSEIVRCRATRARLNNEPARAARLARCALSLDARNFRAAMELAWSWEARSQPQRARAAWLRAARDLPSDAVLERIAPLKGP